jgi:UDP-N-acetylglucosamine 4,6-dehydratase (inverting)
MKDILRNKSILVTGGTGSFGKKFIKILLERHNVRRVVVFSRDELKQSDMSSEFEKYKKKLRFFIGDIRDFRRVKLALDNVDIVIHAAALKQVPTAEYNPFEVIKTNIIGTQNVIDAIIESNVQIAIALSTDKAAAPVNLYGASKLTADKIFVAANNYTKKKFSVVRYGNVMMSRGSVIPIFIKQSKTGVITLTDKRMTRFTITLEQGVNFVIQCLSRMRGGEIFLPKIPSYKVTDVARAFAPNCKIKVLGLRPGEKLHEEMITTTDSYNTIEYKDYYVILPSVTEFLNWKIKNFLKNKKNGYPKKCKENFSYNSLQNDKYLTSKELIELVKNI